MWSWWRCWRWVRAIRRGTTNPPYGTATPYPYPSPYPTAYPSPYPSPYPHGYPQPYPQPGGPGPTPWLSDDPLCTGTLTRAEWLVCDDPKLNELHHRLARQWAAARHSASPDQRDVLEDQLYALLSERDSCQTAACVAKAYHRYLDGPPISEWTPRWVPRRQEHQMVAAPEPWPSALGRPRLESRCRP
ncbi:MAG: hypothetical protein WDN44_05045 [Sphingomonas sp.]